MTSCHLQEAMPLETTSLNELREPRGGDAMRLRPFSAPRFCADPYTGEAQVTQTPTRAVQTLHCKGQSWWVEVGRLRRGSWGHRDNYRKTALCNPVDVGKTVWGKGLQPCSVHTLPCNPIHSSSSLSGLGFPICRTAA